MKLAKRTVCLVLSGLITACAMPAPSATPLPSATLAPTQPTLTLAAAETPMPYLTSPVTATLPAGLVYRTSQGLWSVGAGGLPQRLTADPAAILSPDGTWRLTQCGCAHAGSSFEIINLKSGEIRATLVGATQPVWSPDSSKIYYIAVTGEGSDIWAFDVATGEKRNLSNTPDRTEAFFPVSPDPAGPLIFYSNPPADPPKYVPGEGWLGYLAMMNTDGTGYQVLSQEDLSGYPALSLPGSAVAYTTRAGGAWLSGVAGGARRFSPAPYGLPEDVSLTSPAWSPDGKQIAWWTLGQDGETVPSGVGVYDLITPAVKFSGRFLPPYNDGGPPPAPQWSPDGKWIVFYGAPENQAQYGLWLVNVAGNRARQLVKLSRNSDTCSKAWSADGGWLAFACQDPALAPGIWLADVSAWQLYQTDVMTDSVVLNWTGPRP